VKVEIRFERDDPPQPELQPTAPRATTQARQLALAYHIEALIASGEMKDIAHVARVAGVSRARVSQVLDLMLSAPSVQECVLCRACELGTHALRQLNTITR